MADEQRQVECIAVAGLAVCVALTDAPDYRLERLQITGDRSILIRISALVEAVG